MRGVAAIAVLMFHMGGLSGLHFAPHGYLAVDFFFVLSGFVIARAYEERFRQARLGVGAFMMKRVTRLYPVLAIGFLIGLVIHRIDGDEIPSSWAWALLLVPLIYSPIAFPLNNAVWSLAHELIVNVVHAAVARYLTTKRLIVLVAASALGVAMVAMRAGTLNLGWSLAENATISMWFGGIPRVFFGYFLGVTIWRSYRAGLLRRVNFGWPVSVMVLAAVLVMPVPPSAIYDLVCVYLVFPLLVMSGPSSEPSMTLQPVAKWLGMISYPLYAVHYPLVERLARFQHEYVPDTGSALAFYGASGVAILCFASLLARYFDLKIAARGTRPVTILSTLPVAIPTAKQRPA